MTHENLKSLNLLIEVMVTMVLMVTFIELKTALVDNKNYEIASFASVHSDQA